MTTNIDTTSTVYQDRASELARYLGGTADPERAAEAAAIVRVLVAVNVHEKLGAANALASIYRSEIYPRNSTKTPAKAFADWERKLGAEPLKIVALATLFEHCCRQVGMRRVTSLSREAAIGALRRDLKPAADPSSPTEMRRTRDRKKVVADLKGLLEKPPKVMIGPLREVSNAFNEARPGTDVSSNIVEW